MTQIFTLEALPAHKGDSLILYYGTHAEPKLIVIDGGPSRVYQPALRPRFFDIRAAWGIVNTDPLDIDLLMISHIDDDHIKGILEFAKELKESDDLNKPKFARIATLWHNTFDDIIGNSEIPETVTASLASMGSTDFPAGTDPDMAFILSSVRQGRDLRRYAKALEWETNNPFDPLVMMAKHDDPDVTRFGGGLSFQIIGPRRDELEELQEKYDKFLRDNNLGRDSAEAALAATQDKSVPNLSSIVTLAELGGRTILLTGDALGSKITDAVQARGMATAGAPLKVDVLKMPHHGSDRNVTPEFFQLIKADHYVFCGNGSHGNPERATIQMLFAEQGTDPVTLHFTYPVEKIDEKRKSEAEDHHHAWDPERHSLSALFDTERASGRIFDVKEPNDRTGVRIDLLDQITIPMQ